MHPYPHHYAVQAAATPEGDVPVSSQGLPDLATAPPAEFDGPGDRWSPETLLCAAVADCFLLSFRGVARAAKLPWTSLRCEVRGTLDRVDGKTRFTRIEVRGRARRARGHGPRQGGQGHGAGRARLPGQQFAGGRAAPHGDGLGRLSGWAARSYSSPRHRRAAVNCCGRSASAHEVRPVELDESRRAGRGPGGVRDATRGGQGARALVEPRGRASACRCSPPTRRSRSDGVVFGKPSSRAESLAMLSRLSGRTHEVHTAVAVLPRVRRRRAREHQPREHARDLARRDGLVLADRRGPATRRAATRSRAAPRSSSAISPAATRASWACRSARPGNCSPRCPV